MCNKTEKCRNEWMDKITLTKNYADTINTLKNIRYTDVPLDKTYDIDDTDKKYIEYFLNRYLTTKSQEFEIIDSKEAKYTRGNSVVKNTEGSFDENSDEWLKDSNKKESDLKCNKSNFKYDIIL